MLNNIIFDFYILGNLSAKFDLLPGDSLIGAGMVSYTGIFTSEFRNELELGWV
jgi:hypothetical protein